MFHVTNEHEETLTWWFHLLKDHKRNTLQSPLMSGSTLVRSANRTRHFKEVLVWLDVTLTLVCVSVCVCYE